MTNNEFTIPIPARLKNVAKGGHVAGAEDIIDDALGKEQSEINQDRIDDIVEVKGGSTKSIADLSEDIANEVERASGIEAGLRESIDELGQIGLNPDNAISTDGDDFDGDTTAKRSKIPTIGAIIDGNPGVYDVSKRNPTGGPNSDGKFTLEYILENADTLIPTSRRHGGMKICFVHSSDNNYVQYRLMLPTFTAAQFANVANWQGVDDEPIAGSDNLVKSGGVKAAIGNVELSVENPGYIIDDGDVEIGEVIPARRSSSNWLGYTMMQASAGDIVRAVGTNGNGVLLWAWLDSESRLLARGEKYSVENGEPHIAPNNTAYLLVQFKDSSTIIQYSSNNSIDSDIVDLAEELNLTKEEISKEISGTAPATGAYYPFNFKAGEKYQVKIGDNFSGTVSLLTSSTTGTITCVDYLAQNIGKGETSEIFELTGDADYLRVGTSSAGVSIPFKVYKVTTCDGRLTIVEDKVENIEDIEDTIDIDIASKLSGTKAQGSGVYYPYTFIQGHKYKLYNDSDADTFQAFLHTGETVGERVQTLPTLGHGDSLEFVAEANASYMYIGYTNSEQKYILYDMGALDFRTKEIENELQVIFNGSKASGDGAFVDIYLKQGVKYRITNTSTSRATFTANTYGNKTRDAKQKICDNLAFGESVEFTAQYTTQFLRIGWTSDVVEFKIEDLTTITSRLTKLEVSENSRNIYPFTPDFDLSRVPQLTGERKYIDTKDINVLYNLYDGLMAQYPNYISKIDMSDADQYLPVQRPSALDGLPIYMYHFEPTRYKNLGRTAPSVDDGRRFVVYINCGTHPDEKFNLFTVFYMMKMICENWKNDVNAEMLRTLIDIYVVPCNSPYGFAHTNEDMPGTNIRYGRVNENGVNLNRNYPVDGWTEGGQGTNNYTGPYAGSEYETQLTMYYVKLLKPKVFLDAHTPLMADPWRDKGTVISNGDFPKDIGAAICATTNAIFCKENADYPDLEDWCLYTMQYGGTQGSCAQWVWQNGGCTASTLEGAENNQWHNKEWAPNDWDHTELSERGEWSNTLKEYRSNRLMRENIQYYFNWLLRSIDAMSLRYYNIKEGKRI